MKTKDELAQEIAERVIGTCDEFSDATERVLEEAGMDDTFTAEEMLHAAANHVEACTECGWWFEPSELVSTENPDAETGICDQCRGEE